MKYVVTSVWKPDTIDWQQGRIVEAKDNPHIAEIHWYEIDETTHGSVAIYHSVGHMSLTSPFKRKTARSRQMNVVFRCSTRRMVRAM